MVGVQFTTTGNVTTLGSKMIDQAEAEVNKYISKRYDITSDTFQTATSIPPLVRSLTERLSEGYMWHSISRGGAGEKSIARGNILIKDVRENLKLIADYKMDLLDTTGSVITDMSNTAFRVLSNTKDFSNTFDEDDPLNWAIDSDKLIDIGNNRD